MVCTRCIMIVEIELKKLGLHHTSITLGKAEVIEMISPEQIEQIKIALLQSGLELIESKKTILIEKIKNVVVEMIHYSENQLKTNFSDYLSSKLNYDYTYLANIFSEEQGVTIEHFIIANKIQRVKELMYGNEYNLTEISWKLNYSSVAHLSTQFKKVTGITPSRFKSLECEVN
ncbi:MAG: transcriptional regulator, AraC family [Mucilaginibacter sp.]|jgi:YesN/AraC family two-component response regulator|nr:transcriptional regulator, AraC family [Mucilaginibacter sp.]